MYMQTPTSYTTYAEQHLAARLEDEQSLSMQLAEAAEAAQCRSRARQSLLTLELIHADDDVSAAVAHANIYRRRAENAATVTERLRSQLGALAEYAERGTLERLGVLNPEIAELEELAAIGQASGEHAEYRYEAQLRAADELELAQREELMRLRARLSSAEAAVASERRALETAFRAELEASEARATAAHQAASAASLALTQRDAEHRRAIRSLEAAAAEAAEASREAVTNGARLLEGARREHEEALNTARRELEAALEAARRQALSATAALNSARADAQVEAQQRRAELSAVQKQAAEAQVRLRLIAADCG